LVAPGEVVEHLCLAADWQLDGLERVPERFDSLCDRRVDTPLAEYVPRSCLCMEMVDAQLPKVELLVDREGEVVVDTPLLPEIRYRVIYVRESRSAVRVQQGKILGVRVVVPNQDRERELS